MPPSSSCGLHTPQCRQGQGQGVPKTWLLNFHMGGAPGKTRIRTGKCSPHTQGLRDPSGPSERQLGHPRTAPLGSAPAVGLLRQRLHGVPGTQEMLPGLGPRLALYQVGTAFVLLGQDQGWKDQAIPSPAGTSGPLTQQTRCCPRRDCLPDVETSEPPRAGGPLPPAHIPPR